MEQSSLQEILETLSKMDTAKLIILLITTLAALILVTVIISALMRAMSRANRRRIEAAELRKTEQLRQKAARMGQGKNQSNSHWIQRLTEQYLKSPLAKEAGAYFADHWITVVKNQKRDSEIETVICNGFDIRLEASIPDTPNGVCSIIYHTDLNFTRRNLQPLQSKEEMYALVRAIAILAQETIKHSYKRDESGSQYTLSVHERTGHRCPYSTPEYFIEIDFAYSAPNKYYAPARKR